MCTWLSMRPGISVRRPQSITVALAARMGRSDTSDAVAFDQQLEAAPELVVLGIEEFEILEVHLRHGPDLARVEDGGSTRKRGSSIAARDAADAAHATRSLQAR